MKTWKWILSGLYLLGLPAVAQAQFTYTTNNGAITITGYTGTNGNAVIPAVTNGYPVTSIGGYWYWNYSGSLTNITIPASVTNIASGAFAYQSSLTSIVVDEHNLVYSSTGGILFDKPQTLLIQAPRAIAGTYVIPDTVTSIGDGAFESCASLTDVSIGTNVTSIGADTFYFCGSLTGITIPGSVTNVGSQAFYDCASLTNAVIGSNVLNLGSAAFADCQSLPAITVDPKNLFYSSTGGMLFDKLQTTLLQAPGEITGTPALPASLTSIGAMAFFGCANLTGITIPDAVTNLGSQAFASCSGLTNLTLGAQVTSIGDNAFNYCPGLTSLAIPDQVISIGNGAFFNCAGLTNIAMGANVASVGDNAFADCSALTGFVIPNSVTNLGNAALESCASLTNITIGTGVATIGYDAFADCSSLAGIAIPKSVTNIIGASSGIVRFGTPPATGPIEMVAGCGRLTAITVDEQNPAYSSANGILFNKAQTTLLEAPGAIAGSYAIPGSVTSIGGEAFQNCASLTSLSIPNSVTNIGGSAFAACGSLTAITVDAQNPYYRSTNGILFDKPQTTLIQFPGGIGGSYTIANGITSLGGAAFSGCTNLTRITVPASVTNVGTATFANCSHAGIYFQGNAPSTTFSGAISLVAGIVPISFGNNFYNPNAEAVYYLPGTTGWGATFDGITAYLWVSPYVCTPAGNSITINGFTGSGGAITIPDVINGLPVTALASGLFDNAAGFGLTNITLGANLTTIGSYAFAACANLDSITIPSGVTNLGSYAFTFCDNLQSIYFQGNAPGAAFNVFFQWSSYSFPIFPIDPVYEPPTPTTVYYLPGTTGWGATFDNQPAVLWNPQAQTSGAGFGLNANHFGFNITGASNLVVVVEACTNLAAPDWHPVQTNTLTGGSAWFSDPQATNFPGRFYRLRSP